VIIRKPVAPRYLQMESPDANATVGFLDNAENYGGIVEIFREGNSLRIVVKASHGEGASTWDEQEIVVGLHAREDEDEDDDDGSGDEPWGDTAPADSTPA